ncbi:Cell envelope-associated transcriptional attenuator LytR-CpsA-Psr, subfamily F2 (as in PMID19099556) [Marinilactibacillus psychrotolerans 42ea]|uniref:Cell envelope-associated transcriptional attenuator LytR-CpsA-Psr, subfamily F2 (As in PMID19099556) n=1 Tax=Marinilactibacillus psychrotolerans 42ea TaxID=1255609 RepID=A0A1R4K140_9LACT|nr:LCP family protein [Marinilactibacillus psychrotolerans]SJN37996.1 Cell envelope-associated transcriptional attenuator LytR-CpsA-Psr, subfamily F2 (as in PMID19099556) [Marinilactibacillus psychrotolerans 42ea]
MEDESRVRRKRKKRKKKSLWKKILIAFLVVLLIIVGAGAFVAWRVYSDVQSSTEEMYEEAGHEQIRTNPVVVDDGEEPFSVLLMGIDTGDMGRTDQGRSDTMMLMTVNPNTEKTTIVSIPRDTYTEIVGNGTMDKINHAYAFGGTAMALNTVQNLFDIPVDYFVSVNMEGLQQIVDSIGGVDITPQLTFEQGGYSFVEGQTVHMDGNTALEYSRMRHEDPNGDYGRQERQRAVVEATIRKMASVESVMNYRGVLDSLSANMQTNMSFDDMVDAFTKYNSAIGTVNQEQLSGTGEKQDGVYYEFIPEEEVQRVSNILKEELELN